MDGDLPIIVRKSTTIMKFNTLLPELYVEDFDKSLFFYQKILEWKVEYRRENPRFAFLSYYESQLMIQELRPGEAAEERLEHPYGRGINFQIDTPEVKTLLNQLEKANYPLKRGIKESWYEDGQFAYGCREILVNDPDGYLLRYSEDLGKRECK